MNENQDAAPVAQQPVAEPNVFNQANDTIRQYGLAFNNYDIDTERYNSIEGSENGTIKYNMKNKGNDKKCVIF